MTVPDFDPRPDLGLELDEAGPHQDRRWPILAILGIAQLMVVLDATVVNVALPSAQRAMGFSADSRQWVVTAYALTFGSLLPLGGRLSDLWGRKRMFVAGLAGFAAASALGGAAWSFGVLIGARALQGAFAAVLAPAALSLVNTTFTDPVERNRAFAVFGAIGGAGGAVGLLLGGTVTEYLSWRWCLYVNAAFAVPALVGALVLLVNQVQPVRPRLDLPGTVTASVGLFALVYGLSTAETSGWGAPATTLSLLAGAVLLLGFVEVQRRGWHPLLPPRVVADRDRGASFVALALTNVGLYGVFLFLTYYFQQDLGFSPVRTGLAFLAMPLAMVVSAGFTQTRLVRRFGPRPLISFGLLIAAGGAALLTRIEVDQRYVTGVLPGLIVIAIGLGATVSTGLSTATLGVDDQDSGAAGAFADTSQQLGSAIGLALLSTLAADASGRYPRGGDPTPAVLENATVHGYTVAFWWVATIFAAGAVVCGLLLRGIHARRGRHRHRRGLRRPSVVGVAVAAGLAAAILTGLVVTHRAPPSAHLSARVSAVNGAPAVNGPPAVKGPPALPWSTVPLTDSSLVYASADDGHWDIYTATVTLAGLAARTRLTSGPDRHLHPVLLPGRRTVVYFDGTHDTLRVMAADGTGDRPLFTTGPGAAVKIAPDSRPSVSPDGRALAVAAAAGPAGPGLYVITLDGASARRLPVPTGATDPAWSPAATTIAFWAGPTAGFTATAGSGGIWLVSPAGGTPVRLTATPGDKDPTFSPDGRLIAFTHPVGAGGRAGTVIAEMNADGAGRPTLTRAPGSDTDPAFAPDGRLVVFASRRDHDRELYAMRADGRYPWRLTRHPGFDGVPRWTAG